MRSISTPSHPARDLARELDLAGGGRAEAGAARRGRGDRRQHVRVGVPVDQRPPRADVVDVAVAVDVDQFRALAARDEERDRGRSRASRARAS